MRHDTRRGRPSGQTGALQIAHGAGGDKASVTAGAVIAPASRRAACPLVRAAAALADPAVIAAVEFWHPRLMCPAARRERAA